MYFLIHHTIIQTDADPVMTAIVFPLGNCAMVPGQESEGEGDGAYIGARII